MSKKSYKRHQNRLYKEIKRRIIAENQLIKPIKFSTCERRVETLKIDRIVPNYLAQEPEFVKTEMARSITSKLIADGYVEFHSASEPGLPVQDVGFTRIMAIVRVIRPLPEGW